MKILIVNDTKIPALDYGGTERVIWWLGKELVRRGHKVVYLVAPGSSCPFAEVLSYNPQLSLQEQVPTDVDIVHSQFQFSGSLDKPYLITHHGNTSVPLEYDINTVFVSQNHAERNGAEAYVHNGLDPDEYGSVDFNSKRRHLLFLGYARRPEKNVAACKSIARRCGIPLVVVGGKKNFYNSWFGVEYKGYLGGRAKNEVLAQSKALLFPVRWHEPFGLALIEALYFGCPVFGTRYGSLPEIISRDVGFLSNNASELVSAIKQMLSGFNPRRCHEYAVDQFSSKQMAENYLNYYQRVLSGDKLNKQQPRSQDLFLKSQLLPFSN